MKSLARQHMIFGKKFSLSQSQTITVVVVIADMSCFIECCVRVKRSIVF